MALSKKNQLSSGSSNDDDARNGNDSGKKLSEISDSETSEVTLDEQTKRKVDLEKEREKLHCQPFAVNTDNLNGQTSFPSGLGPKAMVPERIAEEESAIDNSELNSDTRPTAPENGLVKEPVYANVGSENAQNMNKGNWDSDLKENHAGISTCDTTRLMGGKLEGSSLPPSSSHEQLHLGTKSENIYSEREKDINVESDESTMSTTTCSDCTTTTTARTTEPEEPISKSGGGEACRAEKSSSQTSSLLLHRHLLETVEELRLRRAVDVENDARIHQLLTEKHQVESRLREVVSELTLLKQKTEDRIVDARKRVQLSFQNVVEEKAKYVSVAEAAEREMKSLKDDVRALQLSKHTLERKLHQLGRKAEMTASASNSHLNQMAEFEHQCTTISNKISNLMENQERLQKNVQAAVCLNQKLMYVNEHSSCEMDRYKGDIKNLTQQLCEARIASRSHPAEVKHQLGKLEAQVVDLTRQLRQERSAVEEAKKEGRNSKEACKHVTESLAEAHKIISRQVDSLAKSAKELVETQKEVEETQAKVVVLTTDNSQLTQELDDVRRGRQEALSEWTLKEESLQKRLDTLTSDHDTLRQTHVELEELNSSWAKKNVDYLDQIKSLKAELSKPKVDTETQTVAEITETSVQTETSAVRDDDTQTADVQPDCHDISSQTDPTTTQDTSTQTEISTHDIRLPVEETETSQVDSGNILKNSLAVVPVTEKAHVPGKADESVLPSSQPVTGSPRQAIGTAELPFSQPLPSSPLSKVTPSTKEVDLSPYSRFTASLRCLGHNTSTALGGSTVQQSANNIDSSTNFRRKMPEPHSRLKRKHVSRTVSTKTGAGDQVARTGDKAKPSTRYTFQFLRIPDNDDPKCTQSLTGTQHTPQEVSTERGNTEVLAADQSTGLKPTHQTHLVLSSVQNDNIASSEVDHTVMANTMPPSILTDPEAPRQKRSRRVHFADKTQFGSVQEQEDSESDCLFSDENDEPVELTESQADKIENFLLNSQDGNH